MNLYVTDLPSRIRERDQLCWLVIYKFNSPPLFRRKRVYASGILLMRQIKSFVVPNGTSREFDLFIIIQSSYLLYSSSIKRNNYWILFLIIFKPSKLSNEKNFCIVGSWAKKLWNRCVIQINEIDKFVKTATQRGCGYRCGDTVLSRERSLKFQTVEMHAVALKYDRPVQQFIRDYYLTANRLEDV